MRSLAVRTSPIVLGILFIATMSASSLTAQAISTPAPQAATAQDLPARAVAFSKPLTVDDVLKLEDVATALIDPTGRWLVFVQIPPVGKLPDYGSNVALQSGKLMVVDLASSSAPHLLFYPESDEAYTLESFAPDGNRLAFYCIRRGKVSLGVFDLGTKTRQVFPATPEVEGIVDYSPVWISNDEIVYAALPPDQEPAAVSVRRYTGARLFSAWEKTWEGQEASANEIASYADGGGSTPLKGDLVDANARTGESRVLAEGLFADLRVSRDRRYLAASRQYEPPQPSPDRLNTDWVFGRSQLNVFDLMTRASVIVAPEKNIETGSLEWSPDADLLAFFAWNEGASVQSGLFLAFDAVKNQTHAWPHLGLDLVSERERGLYQRPERSAWLGERLAVVARLVPDSDQTPRFTYREDSSSGKADWFLLGPDGTSLNLTKDFHAVSTVPLGVSSKGLFILADGHVWQIGLEGIKKNLTANIHGKLEEAIGKGVIRPRYTDDAIVVSRTRETPEFALVDLRGERPVATIPAPSPIAQLLAGSARAGAAFFRLDSDEGADLLLQRSNGHPVRLERINSFLGSIAKSRWRTISYKIDGERDLQSCVLLPPDYTPGRRYPVVVNIYPSRVCGAGVEVDPAYRLGVGTDFDSNSPHLLAAQGYIVFYVSNPPDLDRTKDGPIAGMANVVLQGIEALVAQGYADPSRLGLYGFSQGGISALWLATQTDRFKAVVSINSWADLASHYLSSGIYGFFYPYEGVLAGSSTRYDSPQGEFGIGQTPWQDPDAYIRSSPVFQAEKIRTPVMMIHSDMDGFPLSQYDEMFVALYRLRKEARFVRYWGEGHGPISPANIRDMWGRILAWYGKYLSAPEPGNSEMRESRPK